MGNIIDLEEVLGQDRMELIEEATFDSIAQGICTNEGCDYVTEVEPDSSTGYCEICKTRTVKSVLVLEGLI